MKLFRNNNALDCDIFLIVIELFHFQTFEKCEAPNPHLL